MQVSALYIYPLKGARGIALERTLVLRSGLLHDRRFMVTNAQGIFLTQRERPRLALVGTAIEGDDLVLTALGQRARVRLRAPDGRPRRTVKVFSDEVVTVDAEGDGAELVSAHLGERCSIVMMPVGAVRPVDRAYAATEADHVSFADAFPVLVASEASLAALNERLADPVPMDRFRANVIVRGGEPWAEESAPHARIGNLELRMPKRCARCQVVTVDQQTAATSKEPLRTLATFRKEGTKVNFAMNGIPVREEQIFVGDPVEYLS